MLRLSTAEFVPPIRLREVPWEALSGLHSWVVPAVAEVLGGQAAERVIDRALRGHRDLSAEGRRAVVEAIFGVGLWRRRLRFSLPGNDDPALLLFGLLHLLGGLDAERARELTGLAQVPPVNPKSPTSLGDAHSLPEWLEAELLRTFGPVEAEAFCRTLAVPAPVFLRANRLRTSREALVAALRAEGLEVAAAPHSPLGIEVLTSRPNLLGLRAQQEGLFEVQDEGSQLLGLLLGARPGETVLDYCAGAGGKALLVAGEVGPSGRVLGHDVDRARLERLRNRAEKSGASNVRIAHAPLAPETLADRVLVDAPCSELGTLRRGPDLRFRIDPATFPAVQLLQSEILASAARHVKPGGTLVYATCTFRAEENAEIARAFERAHPEFERALPELPWLDESFRRDGDFVALPHLHRTDAFYASVFRRRVT